MAVLRRRCRVDRRAAHFSSSWLLVLAFTRNTPPLDNVEQWVWSQGLAWGYYKHPPLPTWLAAALHAVVGRSAVWVSILGAACLTLALWLYARLLTELRGRAFAQLSVLAAMCITYATQRHDLYNHNTVMLPLMAGVACLMWRVAVAPSMRTWLGIGLLMGLGLLTKYQFALVGACVVLWWLRIGGWRQKVHVWGALLAALAAIVVFMPHIWWLVESDWLPLQYASQSSLGAHLPLEERPAHVVLWVFDWLGNRLLPAWLLLVVAWLGLKNSVRWPVRGGNSVPSVPPNVVENGTRESPHDSAYSRDLLLLLGFSPLVLMVLLGLSTGMRLQFKWSTAFWLWTIPAIMVLVPAFTASLRVSPWRMPLVVGIFVLLQSGLLLWQVRSSTPCSPERVCPWSQRSFDEAARLADAFSRENLGGPVQVLSGPYGVTGLLAQRLQRSSDEVPAVLIDGDLAKSPWLDAQTLATSRVVQVWPGCDMPAGAQRIMTGWYVTLPGIRPIQSPEYFQSATWMIAVANGGGTYVSCP
ncbi:glycosyltransferase family 39 protein [Ottowia caeni]|uniref:glycosyltransferase family 39 protein n=1 Tax=Ottowia caeni TaxID=2870339 RepID=UPI003D70856D